MLDVYVNKIFSLIEHPLFNTVASICGVVGITFFGVLAKLLSLCKNLTKKNDVYKLSINDLELRLRDQRLENSELKSIIAKDNADLEIFINILPEDDDRVHGVFHVLQACALHVGAENIRMESDHIANIERAFPDSISFLTESVNLIARKRLIFQSKYGCARYFVSLQILQSLMGEIGRSHLRNENSSNGANLGSKISESEYIEEFNPNELDVIYELSKQFQDVNSIDILVAIKILDLEFLTEDEIAREIKLRLLRPEIKGYFDAVEDNFSSRFAAYPNMIMAICIANDKSGSFLNDYDFGDEMLKEVDKISADGGRLPDLMTLMETCSDLYRGKNIETALDYGARFKYYTIIR